VTAKARMKKGSVIGDADNGAGTKFPAQALPERD
jgi:hypothetical protein